MDIGRNIKKSICCVYISSFFLLFNSKKSGPDIFIPAISLAIADNVLNFWFLYVNVPSALTMILCLIPRTFLVIIVPGANAYLCLTALATHSAGLFLCFLILIRYYDSIRRCRRSH